MDRLLYLLGDTGTEWRIRETGSRDDKQHRCD
nr:MAG TPA: hypothetical protein [Caudoviricetes sp.]